MRHDLKMFVAGIILGAVTATAVFIVFMPNLRNKGNLEGQPQVSKQVEPFGTTGTQPPAASRAIVRADSKLDSPRNSGTEERRQSQLEDRVNFLAELKSRGVLGIHSSFLRGDTKLSLDPTFSDIFGLTDKESAAIQSAVDEANAKLEQLALASATSSRKSDDTIEIVVRPFSGGPDVYDRFMNTIGDTLGPGRSAAFSSIYGNDVITLFHSFGAEYREIVVKRNSETQFVITESARSDKVEMLGEPRGVNGISAVKKSLGPLATFLPW